MSKKFTLSEIGIGILLLIIYLFSSKTSFFMNLMLFVSILLIGHGAIYYWFRHRGDDVDNNSDHLGLS